MKALLVPFGLIFTSFFYFPFYFTFLPEANTKMILALFGLIWLLVRMGERGDRSINKDFFLVSLYAAGVSLASFLTMIVNDSVDGAYLGYLVTMWVWTGAAYFVVNFIKAVHGKVSVELVCFYMIAVGALQCLLAILIDIYAPLKNVVDSFLAGEGFMGKAVEGRLYGIGCALDVAGGRFAVLLVMIAFLLPNMFSKTNPYLYVIPLLIAFGIIAIIGNMIGRTTTVGLILAVAYWIYILLTKQVVIGKERTQMIRWIVGGTFVVMFVSISLYHASDFWHKYFRFGFEGFFSLVEKGSWEIQSNEMLKEGLIFPDNFRTWIIGDGYMGAMKDDPYYQGEFWYGFYKGTDAGYSRFLFYFGLIGLGAFIIFLFKVCRVCMKSSVRYQYMFLAIFLLNMAIWIKVSTDIFLAFAPFLCLAVQGVKDETVEFADSVQRKGVGYGCYS